MPPLVVDVVNGHRAALLQRDEQVLHAQAQRWLQVEQELQARTDMLALQLADEPVVTMGRLNRMSRYRDLRAQVDDELRRYTGYLEPRIRTGQRELGALAIQHSQQAVQSVAIQAQMNVSFNRLPVSAVENMVGLAGDGSPLHDILADAARVGPDALAEQLVNGIALGRNPITVARLAIQSGLAQSFTRMQAISRTEQLRVYRLTTLQSYENSRVVSGYRRLSARDQRTCIGCLFSDGRLYSIQDGFDEHVQGRCTMIPVLVNSPPIAYEVGQQWFRSQSADVQQRMMGPGRYDLWQRNEVTLDDLVSRDWNDTWGGSLRPASLAELRR